VRHAKLRVDAEGGKKHKERNKWHATVEVRRTAERLEYNPHETKEGDLGGGDGVVPLIAGGVFQFLLDRRERGQRMRSA